MTPVTGNACAVKLLPNGEVVYYIADELHETDEEYTYHYWDLKKHILPNGTVRSSYHHYTPDANALSFFGYAAGERVILDESYHELRRIHLLPGNYSATPWLDGHDFILIDDNHYIVSAYLQMNVDNIPDDLTTAQNSTIVASLIQEVQDGEVIFEFCTVDHPELLYLVPITAERIGDETIADFSNTQTLTPDTVHFNSMTLAADDTLICLLIPPPLRHSEDQPDDRRNCMDTDKSGDNRQQCQRSGCDIPCIL